MKRKFYTLLLAVPLILPMHLAAQQLKLGDHPATINKAAVLELESNKQGLLLTRIIDTTVAPLTTAPDGTLLFFKGDNSLRIRSGNAWKKTLTSVDTTDIANFDQKVRSLFSGTAPLTYSDGQIGITQAGSASNGYLSSTDWNTFNSKLSSVDTSNIPNFYQKVRSELSAGSGISYNSTTGVISLSTGAGSSWLQGGNSVSSMQNLGTTSNYDLPLITNNTERMRINTAGNVAIGTSNFNSSAPERLLIDAGNSNSSYNLIYAKGSVNNYLQFNIQNDNGGQSASSDIVATANNGNENTNYINMGINSSSYSNSNIVGGNNNAYLYSTGSDLIIGNATSNKDLIIFTGGTATTNEAIRVESSGEVGIAISTPQAKLDVGGNFKLGAAGTVMTNIIKTNISITDNTNIGYTSPLTKTIAVSGAQPNASVIVNPRTALPAGLGIAYSYVSSTDNITINFTNTGAGTLGLQKLGSVTLDITMINL